ncbi:hypothetical protein BH23VER1_BH23VER1_37600 [soil metagenome]
MLRKKRGFTLIELLAVIIILGILVTIAVPRLWDTRLEAFRAAAVSDLRNLATAQELFWEIERGYANQVELVDVETSKGVDLDITESSHAGWAAVARHTSFPSSECGIFVGTADPANGSPGVVVGEIHCSR